MSLKRFTIFLFAAVVGGGEMVPQVMASPNGKDHCVCEGRSSV